MWGLTLTAFSTSSHNVFFIFKEGICLDICVCVHVHVAMRLKTNAIWTTEIGHNTQQISSYIPLIPETTQDSIT